VFSFTHPQVPEILRILFATYVQSNSWSSRFVLWPR